MPSKRSSGSSSKTLQSIQSNQNDSKQESNIISDDLRIQIKRIEKLLNEMVWKLKLMSHMPYFLVNNGEFLRGFLKEREVDFIVSVCKKYNINPNFSKTGSYVRIGDGLKFASIDQNQPKLATSTTTTKGIENYDPYIHHAIELILNSGKSELIMNAIDLDCTVNDSLDMFIKEIEKFRLMALKMLQKSGTRETEEINQLRSAYRQNVILDQNVKELEEFLAKQRKETNEERERRECELETLKDNLQQAKDHYKREMNMIVCESEKSMMKEYNANIAKIEDLAQGAKSSEQQLETSITDHVSTEKVLRARKLKVETQLASWLAKYDTDMMEKQIELDNLQNAFDHETEEIEKLQKLFDVQKELYLELMDEKEAEERAIYEEKAYVFLQNRSARKIQRYWREYKERKARRKAKKGKKKEGGGGGGGGKKGKAKSKKKVKIKEDKQVVTRQTDFISTLDSTINISLLEDVKDKSAFDKKDIEVDLEAN